MATFQKRVLLDCAEVRRLRKQRGWTQQELAYESGISVRWIQKIEANPKTAAVHQNTADALAKALMVPVEHLVKTVLQSWHHVPTLDQHAKLRGIMSLAVKEDMDGAHASAAKRTAEVLKSLRYSVDKDAFLEVYLLWIKFLDNGGEHDKAIAAVDALLSLIARDSRPDKMIVLRAKYLRGIALRRSMQLFEARELFNTLLVASGCPAMTASIYHQLGVIELEFAKTKIYLKCRSAMIENSLAFFEESLTIWNKLGASHREGYSLMRAGEALAMQGRYEAGMRHFVHAIKVLSAYNMARYVRETEQRIEECIYKQNAFKS